MKQIPESFIQYVVEQCKTIQQIPSPTFNEQQKAEYIARQFEAVNKEDTVIDPTGNVHTKIRGIKSNKPLVISAHLDTVHPIDTDLSITENNHRITGPSIGDNSLGLATLLMLHHYFHDLNIVPRQDIWLVANTTEEGLGNLEGMKSIVNMFKTKPSAYIILEGMGLGRVVTQGLSVQRYRVNFQCDGGAFMGRLRKNLRNSRNEPHHRKNPGSTASTRMQNNHKYRENNRWKIYKHHCSLCLI